MPHCVAYGCIPKVRTAAEATARKFPITKFLKKPIEESMGIKNPMFRSGAQ